MKVKVSEATGPVLDWMVATLDGYTNLRVGVFSSVLMHRSATTATPPSSSTCG